MILTELEVVASETLPVAKFSDHLRLGSGFADDGSEDAVLENYLRAALAAIEAQTGKAVLERRFLLSLNAWRQGDWQGLPLAPVSAVEAVAIVAETGEATTVDASLYRLQSDGHRPRLCSVAAALPTIPSGARAEITLRAGYANDWVGLPPDLAQAVLMLAASYFEHRHGLLSQGHNLPGGVAALLERYRPIRLGGALA